jgi:NTP pyrophosphatase (non-canonical NTP hydrolase)
MTIAITDLVRHAHGTSREKGWWDDVPDVVATIPEKIALMHSELSEALEEFRKPDFVPTKIYFADAKPEGFAIELADAVIRIADLCGALGIDLNDALERKMAFNLTRPQRHGGKRI